MIAVVNRLHHAAETERQPFEIKLGLDAGVHAHREALAGEDAAAGQTQVKDAALDLGPGFDKKDDDRGIHLVALV